MLTAYRRHLKTCPHRTAGRAYRRCRCPVWVDGFLAGREIRQSLDTQDWEKAQRTIREWESRGSVEELQESGTAVQDVTLDVACRAFEHDARDRKLRESTLKKYRALFTQLKAFAKLKGLRLIRQVDLETLREFRHSWSDGGISSQKKLERLRAFFRFVQDSGWLKDNPTRKLKAPVVREAPTLPYNQDEMIRIIAACRDIGETCRPADRNSAERLYALVLLLRDSGMRIGDAATCEKARLRQDKLFLYTQKTGVPVRLKLPAFVAEALRNAPSVCERYFFWTGEGSKETAAGNWRRSLRAVFRRAGIPDGHPHRFRDTFATELLLAGTPLEPVSILLGHSSTRVAEKHYSHWVRSRQEQLEANLERSWKQDPIVLAETKGTPEVHGKREVVN